MLSFLKEEVINLRHQLTFIGDKMEIYLPTSYLESTPSFADVMGENIETLGIFNFKCDKKLYEINLPIRFQFSYSDRKKLTGKLKPELPENSYDVFILNKGDIFCYDTNHRENIKDIMFFMNTIIEGGKIPSTVSYSNILNLLLQAMDVTKSGNMGLSSVSYELLLSELIRTKSNLNQSYRIYINNHPNKNYDYKMIKLTKIPEFSSAFLGLIGEDNSQQIVSAIMNTRSGRQDKVSPAEKLLKL